MKAKQKLLTLLEHDREEAQKGKDRWAATLMRYEADLLFNQEHDLPTNMLTVQSRNLAKEEVADAREMVRLYTIAINAVRKA